MADPSEPAPGRPVPPNLAKIENFVVLMFENRSFDHMLGFLKDLDSSVEGLTGQEMNEDIESGVPGTIDVRVARARCPFMPFDPPHEFPDIDYQLDPWNGLDPKEVPPAPMGGFVFSAKHAAATPDDAYRVMECFKPEQVPVLTALAREFALFNFWHSSLPGPTFPNRFFVHAATSGGLSVSPSEEAILLGFAFEHGTIYKHLERAKKDWRIYHDGFPQTAAITELRGDFLIGPRFRKMEDFYTDVQNQTLKDYTFIEPDYEVGKDYKTGTSMHPMGDVRDGETLLKKVYEKLRGSPYYWPRVMLVVLFDEHGGFYDHVNPPETIAPDDDARFDNPDQFEFDRLGVRVPALVVSAYTEKGTVIGSDSDDDRTRFDHASIVATVNLRYGLQPLTKRDSLANTLDVALNREAPRMKEEEARMTLPDPAADALFPDLVRVAGVPAAAPAPAPVSLSPNEKCMVALAYACDTARSVDPALKAASDARRQNVNTPEKAAAYIKAVEISINESKGP